MKKTLQICVVVLCSFAVARTASAMEKAQGPRKMAIPQGQGPNSRLKPADRVFGRLLKNSSFARALAKSTANKEASK